MQILISWDNSEKHNPTKKDTAGYLWLHRAILAHKLKRQRLSQSTLRNVVEQGGSFFAWNLLLEIYSHGQSTVGVLRTITEVIRFMDVQNLIDYSKVPRWLEIHLHQIISVKGATEVVRVC